MRAVKGNYMVERILKPFLISDKIIDKMDTKNYEKVVRDSKDMLNLISTTKATKAGDKRLQKRNNTFNPVRRKVIYNLTDEQSKEAVKEVYNLKERALKNELNILVSKEKTNEQIIKHFRGQGVQIESYL
jgi:hypothetical protein